MPVMSGISGTETGHELSRNSAGFAWFVLTILSALPLFWFGLAGLADEWSRPEFSHGPVIPVLSFYMFLREMKVVPPGQQPVTDRWPGVLVIGLALLIAVLGNLMRVDDIVFYALIIWTGGLVLTCFGWRRGLTFWPSVLHLVFMLPLPMFLYWKVSTALQFVSSGIGVWLVQSAGIPVFLDGNIIDLGVYKLQVAEACSGLRYLFPIMSFTYVFAVLYRGPVWHKLVLLLSAVPIAVLMNSVRIGIIGILVDSHGIEQAEGFLHVFEGWVIFLACIGLLFLMAIAMQRFSGDHRRLGDALEMDFTGLGSQMARVFTIIPSRALILAACLTATLSAAWSLAPSQQNSPPERDPFSLFPLQVGEWSGASVLLDPGIENVLKADDYFSAYYRNPDEAEGMDLFLSYYHSQTNGSAIHSPEVCIPGAGWEIFSIRRIDMDLPDTQFGNFSLNRAIIQKGLDKQLVYYWFEGRGRRMTDDIAAKFQTLADGARTGRTDGGLVRLITPIGEDGIPAADARLQHFLSISIDRLPRFIPE
jgi:exosortase D (VPLPA-CTERM-specific)